MRKNSWTKKMIGSIGESSLYGDTYRQRHETEFNRARVQKWLKAHVTFVDESGHVMGIFCVMRTMRWVTVHRIHCFEERSTKVHSNAKMTHCLFTQSRRTRAIRLPSRNFMCIHFDYLRFRFDDDHTKPGKKISGFTYVFTLWLAGTQRAARDFDEVWNLPYA